MRKLLTIAALAGLTALPAGAAPLDASGTVRQAVRAAMPGTTLVWWHAGGTTAWGNHWQAGGTGAYGAHPAYGYHGYAGGAWYHGPVAAPVPYYHPGGAFAAGAVDIGIQARHVGDVADLDGVARYLCRSAEGHRTHGNGRHRGREPSLFHFPVS